VVGRFRGKLYDIVPEADPTVNVAPVKLSLKEFLEKIPPGREVVVSAKLIPKPHFSPTKYILDLPVLDLYCNTCGVCAPLAYIRMRMICLRVGSDLQYA
jgi:hypothetical protein